MRARQSTILRVGAAAAVAVGLFGEATPAGTAAGTGTPRSAELASAIPKAAVPSPRDGSYERGSRIGADYVNPLRAVRRLRSSRIDMGVDYSGSGPILAIGAAKVVTASYVPGPESCWGRTCAPAPGGWVVYRLLDGPFVGKYVYAVENITLKVKVGQLVTPGQVIAVLHPGSPNLEIGWAAGRRAETLAIADHHQCACIDPGGWSSIEGRNFNGFLMRLGAPSGYLQETPRERMPRGWPALPARA